MLVKNVAGARIGNPDIPLWIEKDEIVDVPDYLVENFNKGAGRTVLKAHVPKSAKPEKPEEPAKIVTPVEPEAE